MKTILTIRNKELHRLNLAIAFIMVFFTCVGMISSFYWAIVLVFTIPVITKTAGVQIDLGNGLHRDYSKFLGKTKGIWKSTERYSCMVILTKAGKKSVSRTMMLGDFKVEGYFHELYFMDTNHKRKFYIHSSKNIKELEEIVKEVQASISLPLQEFRTKKILNYK